MPNIVKSVRAEIKVLLICLISLFITACASFSPRIEPIGHTYYVNLKTKNGPIKVFLRDEGHGDPVLLLHGFGANLFTWRYLYPDLSKRHRVIAIDMKGFGKSDKPYDKAYSAFDQATLIMQLIKKLKLKKITLVGHSFGGGVAIATLFKLKARGKHIIKRLVIMDGLAYAQPIPFFLKVVRSPFLSHLGMAIIPPEIHTRASLSYSYKDPKKITNETINNYADPYYSIDSIYAAKQTAKQLLPKNLEAYTTLYSNIDIPTLLIWCQEDRVVPVVNGLKLHQTLPNSKLKIFNECGHIPQEESPSETVEAMQDFFKANPLNKKKKRLKGRKLSR